MARGREREQVYVEPWQAGGWVVRLEHHPVPLSHHDTEDEAEFRAASYRWSLERGQRLALPGERSAYRRP